MAFSALPLSERKIIGAILDAAASRGLLVSVFDGEEWALKASADFVAARSVIGATCETTLRFRNPAGLDADTVPASVGAVSLIHGNGCDVIHDFTDSPEMAGLLAGALALSDQLGVV